MKRYETTSSSQATKREGVSTGSGPQRGTPSFVGFL